ncbi:MAG: GxxExxY protein [Candidatus Latescibacteria bacterium]|nr:GxxExxY protein [Candidatus Latescibacterota bacterium]
MNNAGTEKEKNIVENYDYIKDCITTEDKEQLFRLREAILNIYEIHNLGYGETICLELLKAELDYQKIKYETETPINVEFEGNFIRTYQMKFPVVADRFVCGITAIKGKVDFYDIARIQTYLKALGLHFGVLINFGKKQLEIRGVCA